MSGNMYAFSRTQGSVRTSLCVRVYIPCVYEARYIFFGALPFVPFSLLCMHSRTLSRSRLSPPPFRRTCLFLSLFGLSFALSSRCRKSYSRRFMMVVMMMMMMLLSLCRSQGLSLCRHGGRGFLFHGMWRPIASSLISSPSSLLVFSTRELSARHHGGCWEERVRGTAPLCQLRPLSVLRAFVWGRTLFDAVLIQEAISSDGVVLVTSLGRHSRRLCLGKINL